MNVHKPSINNNTNIEILQQNESNQKWSLKIVCMKLKFVCEQARRWRSIKYIPELRSKW